MSGDSMTGFVSSLTTGITPDSLWGALTNLAPLIILILLFAFSYNMYRRLMKGASKGKFRT